MSEEREPAARDHARPPHEGNPPRTGNDPYAPPLVWNTYFAA
jgi:hypothetical protein